MRFKVKCKYIIVSVKEERTSYQYADIPHCLYINLSEVSTSGTVPTQDF